MRSGRYRSQAAHDRLREHARALGPEVVAALRDALRRACMPAWTGRRETLEWADVVLAIETEPGLDPGVRALLVDAAKKTSGKVIERAAVSDDACGASAAPIAR